MGAYLRLLGSLAQNLARRLAEDLADCAAVCKRGVVYKLRSFRLRYDDVGPAGASPAQDCQIPPEQLALLVESLRNKPWFCEVDRKNAQDLVHDGGPGCFLVRPSASTRSLTLTLWHNYRAFNILIRQREDGLLALGSKKQQEMTFRSVEEMVCYYESEPLILYSGGEPAGRTRLKAPPPGLPRSCCDSRRTSDEPRLLRTLSSGTKEALFSSSISGRLAMSTPNMENVLSHTDSKRQSADGLKEATARRLSDGPYLKHPRPLPDIPSPSRSLGVHGNKHSRCLLDSSSLRTSNLSFVSGVYSDSKGQRPLPELPPKESSSKPHPVVSERLPSWLNEIEACTPFQDSNSSSRPIITIASSIDSPRPIPRVPSNEGSQELPLADSMKLLSSVNETEPSKLFLQSSPRGFSRPFNAGGSYIGGPIQLPKVPLKGQLSTVSMNTPSSFKGSLSEYHRRHSECASQNVPRTFTSSPSVSDTFALPEDLSTECCSESSSEISSNLSCTRLSADDLEDTPKALSDVSSRWSPIPSSGVLHKEEPLEVSQKSRLSPLSKDCSAKIALSLSSVALDRRSPFPKRPLSSLPVVHAKTGLSVANSNSKDVTCL